MNADISIIIPIYNESMTLRELLAGLSTQTLLPREVIFVDSGSVDESIGIIQEVASRDTNKFDICILVNPGGLPGGNRNRGIEKAKGEWIAFIDAGIVPEIDWLENLMTCINSRNIKTVYGQCHFDADTAFQKAVCAISYGCGTVHPVLPASLFHCSIFKSVGLFREDIRAAEDLLWLQCLEKNYGSRQVCIGALVHYRHFPQNFVQLVQKWWGYELSGIRSGIVSRETIWLSFIFLILFILALTLLPLITISSLVLLVVARGLISPIRRSHKWHWWGAAPAALLIAIWVCIVRDASKLLARAYSLLRPSGER
jgi:glycosyltransferase involved in cell wall biosynthesis